MHLLRTGAFARATRSTKIAARTPRPTSASSRRASSQAAARDTHPFPEQSVDGSKEVDPAKTAADSEISRERESFAHRLMNAAENQVIHENLSGAKITGAPYIFDRTTNVTGSILGLVGRNLYDHPDHPICITRKLIESCFPSPEYQHFTVKDPVVTPKDNFDVLGFPQDHPGRSRTDTYYINSGHLLRTHTSAHQHTAFQSLAADNQASGYTICADVYRRDSIDRSHFPVFHQMEGAKVWKLDNPNWSRWRAQNERTRKITNDVASLKQGLLNVEDQATEFTKERNNPLQPEHDSTEVEPVVKHLKLSLEHLVHRIFTASQASLGSRSQGANEPLKARWIEAYFPFTSPSFELEVEWQGEWLELLGSGVVQNPILKGAGLIDHIGWAWGLGIERFAMLLFGVPDIRLFWSTDARFLKQFQRGKVTKFEPFSKYPACYKDVAFWISPTPAGGSPLAAQAAFGAAAAAGGDATKASPTETQPAAFHENDIMEIVRDVAGSLVEDVKLVDEFIHPTSGRKSLCYRLNYRSLERTLTNGEVNALHQAVVTRLQSHPGLELR